jgi:hypothetical protein
MVLGPQYGSARPCVSISVQSNFFSAIVTIAIVLVIAGWPNDGNFTSVLNDTEALWRIWYVSSKFQKKASSRSCKTPHNHHHFHRHHHRFCPMLPPLEETDPHHPPQQQQMTRRTIFFSQPYLSPTKCAATEWASPAARAQFWRPVKDHNIPYWGRNRVIRVLKSADGEIQDVLIRALLALPTLPFRVSYPSLTLVQFHDCIRCPLITYPEDSGNPPYKFHLESAAESQPSSNTKLSSSSSVAKSQSSCRSLTSSVAELQLFARYNGCRDNSSNPHSPGLNNWQRNRSSNRLDSYINSPSDNTSNPHSPGLGSWHSNRTDGEGKGSSSGFYNLKMDYGQVPQGSGSGSSSSEG